MSTNLALDDRLIEEARAMGGHKTKREAVQCCSCRVCSAAKTDAHHGPVRKNRLRSRLRLQSRTTTETGMMVVVDTSIWSLPLRRVSGALSTQQQKHVHALRELLSEGRVQLLGAVRQELLSGIRHKEQFVRLRITCGRFQILRWLPRTTKQRRA